MLRVKPIGMVAPLVLSWMSQTPKRTADLRQSRRTISLVWVQVMGVVADTCRPVTAAMHRQVQAEISENWMRALRSKTRRRP